MARKRRLTCIAATSTICRDSQGVTVDGGGVPGRVEDGTKLRVTPPLSFQPELFGGGRAGAAHEAPPVHWERPDPSRHGTGSALPFAGRRLSFVDLFCGTGGLSCGLIEAGHRPVRAFDRWIPALRVYNHNLGGEHVPFDGSPLARPLDLSDEDLAVRTLSELRMGGEDFSLLVGGPPCQEFSIAAARKLRKQGRAELTVGFSRIVSRLMPEVFVMENVPGARGSAALDAAMANYRAAGYGLTTMILNAANCEVPQSRERLVCVGAFDAEDGFLTPYVSQFLQQPRSVLEHFRRVGHRVTYERFYAHPHNYGKKAVYGVVEVAPTVRGIHRPKPRNYDIRVAAMAARGLSTPNNFGEAPYDDVEALTEVERGLIQGFPSRWEWFPDGRKGSLGMVAQIVGNAVPVGMGRVVGHALRSWMSEERAHLAVDLHGHHELDGDDIDEILGGDFGHMLEAV